jgi:hypothetical protein
MTERWYVVQLHWRSIFFRVGDHVLENLPGGRTKPDTSAELPIRRPD